MDQPIVNRVEASGLVQLELDRWISVPRVVSCDLATELVDGWVLMEKPFREAVKGWDAEAYAGLDVAIHCRADAILPDWAWMLAASRIVELGGRPHVGAPEAVAGERLIAAIDAADVAEFEGQRVMVRGCASVGGPAALAAVVRKLQPVVKSLMFGEACSSVPVYKKR